MVMRVVVSMIMAVIMIVSLVVTMVVAVIMSMVGTVIVPLLLFVIIPMVLASMPFMSPMSMSKIMRAMLAALQRSAVRFEDSCDLVQIDLLIDG